MEIKRISKWILISGTLVIWAIKFGIRPFNHFSQPSRFLLGVAPNFFAAFLIPFGACFIFRGREFLLARIFRTQSIADLRVVCLLGFGIAVVNEYLQLIPIFGRTFDVYDIVFSAVGLLISYFVFSKLYENSTVRVFPD